MSGKKLGILIMALLTTMAVSACGAGGSGTTSATSATGTTGATNASGGAAQAPKAKAEETYKASTDPVTISILPLVSVTDEEFQHWFADPIKAKYPYITMKLVRLQKGETLESLVTAGTVPDVLSQARQVSFRSKSWI
jgi:hypothetical protein